jgi:lipopolysaccharide assembly outer membrane protein LptD (OstA)
LLKACSSGKLSTWFWLLFLTFFINEIKAITLPQFDLTPDTLVRKDDTTRQYFDPEGKLQNIMQNIGDTVVKQVKTRTTIDDMVVRTASDSIVQDLMNRKVYMFGEAEVTYGNIKLKAAFIEVDFSTNTVFASGLKDSTGKLYGNPEFTEGDQTFKSRLMTYNFTTKKGIITDVMTQDEQGYLHGEKVKKMDDNTINMLHGWYSTCSNETHPHFAFKFKKSRVIPEKKIVTGPAYLEIEGMPTPLGLPFGIFPNTSKRKSGILIPTFGEVANKGFGLEGGGYYWAINDYMDLKTTFDIYTGGSWTVRPVFNYKKRYKYNGGFEFGVARNVIGTKGATDYSNTMDYRIRWSHRQDPKARPRSTFSANVNIVTSNYVAYNVVDVEDYLSNEFQSSVAYQTSWANRYYLTLNSSFRQNTKTHQVNLALPELTFTVNTLYPLRKKAGGGKKRFYEDLSIAYSMNAKNTINTVDSLLFTNSTITKYMQNGAVHKIPISLPLKVLKHFTLSNSFNITDRMYSMSKDKYWANDTVFQGSDTLINEVVTDTVWGFSNALDYSLSTSLGTKLYGQVNLKKGLIKAVRHVFTPSIGFAYNPDFGSERYNYYDSYIDGNGNKIFYSKFDGSLYGSPPNSKSSRLTYSFANNLEMKVRNRKDTITGMKKITLIDRLVFSGSYDFAKDSFNISPLSVSGNTRLWKDFSIQYTSLWDPYMFNSEGKRINQTVWNAYNRVFRWQNTNWSLSLSYSLGDDTFNKKKKNESVADKTIVPSDELEEMNEILDNPSDYVDWNIPWSLSFNYTFQYRTSEAYEGGARTIVDTYVQTLGVNGQINITPKWKFTIATGWDFNQNALSFTNISLYRDLHCWEMRFNWVPIGTRKSWNFSINVKASILQDMKLNKKNDFRDN